MADEKRRFGALRMFLRGVYAGDRAVVELLFPPKEHGWRNCGNPNGEMWTS